MITCDRVSKTFRLYRKPVDRLKEILFRRNYHTDFAALREISLAVAPGESLGVIGPNGAGKSTLLKVLRGVLLPDEGTVSFGEGGRIAGLLELGTGFNMELSGLDNILLNGLLCGLAADEVSTKRQAIVDFAELGEFIYEPLKTYSSGMLMRLGFSIAIHTNPACFLVDEALAVGDAYFCQKCTDWMRRFRGAGGSLVLVSHDLGAIKFLCDRALLLHHGRVIENGRPEDVVNAYTRLIATMNERGSNLLRHPEQPNTYGDFGIAIASVELIGARSGGRIISSGEDAAIAIELVAAENVPDATVGIVIRDRYGQDIYGTNTHHLGLHFALTSGRKYSVRFEQRMELGNGLYTITAAVHTGDTHLDRCFTWSDRAADFEVAGNTGPFFVGMVKLNPTCHIEKHDGEEECHGP